MSRVGGGSTLGGGDGLKKLMRERLLKVPKGCSELLDETSGGAGDPEQPACGIERR